MVPGEVVRRLVAGRAGGHKPRRRLLMLVRHCDASQIDVAAFFDKQLGTAQDRRLRHWRKLQNIKQKWRQIEINWQFYFMRGRRSTTLYATTHEIRPELSCRENITKARSFNLSNLTSWIGSDRNRFIPKKSPTVEYSWKIQLTFPHVSQPHPKKKSEKKNVGSFYSSIISQTFPQPETMAE